MQVQRITHAVLAIGLLTGSSAMAQERWRSDDATGAASSEVVVEQYAQSQPWQFAQRSSGTMSDAGTDRERARTARDNGAVLVQSNEAERQRLERAGFPQYAP